jgi:hypothetical protein
VHIGVKKQLFRIRTHSGFTINQQVVELVPEIEDLTFLFQGPQLTRFSMPRKFVDAMILRAGMVLHQMQWIVLDFFATTSNKLRYFSKT